MQNQSGARKTPLLKRRGPLQIVFEVLGVCNQPQNRTRIMQRANLSNNQLREVLEVLKKYGLIEINEDQHKKYVVSAKGKEYTKRYSELQKLISLPDAPEADKSRSPK